jgi:hypothetical protein
MLTLAADALAYLATFVRPSEWWHANVSASESANALARIVHEGPWWVSGERGGGFVVM